MLTFPRSLKIFSRGINVLQYMNIMITLVHTSLQFSLLRDIKERSRTFIFLIPRNAQQDRVFLYV